MSNPPPPPVPGGAPPVPPPAPGVPPVPSVPPVPPAPSLGGTPPPPSIPAAPAAPAAPAPAAGTAPTMPLRPAAPGGVQLGGGLRTVALTPASGAPTAQLPKATIALTPTQPLGAAAPVSSMQASFASKPMDDEETATDKVSLTLSIIALVVACVLGFVQYQTDALEDRTVPGMTSGK